MYIMRITNILDYFMVPKYAIVNSFVAIQTTIIVLEYE